MGFEEVNYKSKTGCRGTINQLSWKFERWPEVHCLFGEGKDQVVKTITRGGNVGTDPWFVGVWGEVIGSWRGRWC